MRSVAPFLLAGTASAFVFPPTPDLLTGAVNIFNSVASAGESAIARLSTPQIPLGEATITLAQVPSDEHYVLTSSLHPKHKVHIKSTDGWCDPDARSWTGYIDTGGGKELFFYFFESRDKPEEDPVVMWINGGPGCSSEIGLFMELGPCTVKDDPKGVNDTKQNPHSWNKHANVFFLDEPVNVGFSDTKNGQVVSRTEDAAVDVAAFVTIFFDTFKEFRGRAFHMAGESYGGRYLPVFASAVYDNNRALKAAGKEPVNLQSVLIGNGITDWYSTTESYYPFLCTESHDLNATVLPIGDCVELAEAVPKCHRMAKEGCIDSTDPTTCLLAVGYCSLTLGSSVMKAGLNPYDISKPCTLEELSDSLCYPATKKIGKYLNLPETRELLGIHKKMGDWVSCNGRVNMAFHANLDNQAQTWLYVAQLLERGVRVMNYVGTLDWICNHLANRAWVEKLEWAGQKDFNKAELRDWHVGKDVAGKTKTAGNLSFLTIYGAGHMVPMDQPERAAAFFEAWLKGKDMPK